MITPNIEGNKKLYESGFTSEDNFIALKTLARKELNAILDSMPKEPSKRDIYSLLGLTDIITGRGYEGWVPVAIGEEDLIFDIDQLVDSGMNLYRSWGDHLHRTRVYEMSLYHVRQLRNVFEDIYAALNEIQCLLQEVSIDYFEKIFEGLEPEFINLVKEIDELGVYGFMCRNEFTDQLNAGILNTLDVMKAEGLEISYPDFSEPDIEE